MTNLTTLATALALAMAASAASAAAGEKAPPDLDIVKTYAEDFTHDPAFVEPVTFGVKSGDDFYTVAISPASENAPADVAVRKGAPAAPTFYFTFDEGYLGKLHTGDLNILTGMAKAFSTDVTPIDIDVMDGFQPPEDFGDTIVPFTFHFWTKGQPEIVPISADKTRFTHGANAGILYYQPGLRSGWFNILPGQHVNEHENSRTNPFPSMFIMMDGEVTALVGDERTMFQENTMMFVPAGVSHQFINEGTEPAFGFLFMFGDGA